MSGTLHARVCGVYCVFYVGIFLNPLYSRLLSVITCKSFFQVLVLGNGEGL